MIITYSGKSGGIYLCHATPPINDTFRPEPAIMHVWLLPIAFSLFVWASVVTLDCAAAILPPSLHATFFNFFRLVRGVQESSIQILEVFFWVSCIFFCNFQ